MPKIRQQNMQVFIITKDNDINEIEAFIAKNQGILRLYLLFVEELSPRLKECLDKYELDYLQPKNFNFNATRINVENKHFISKDSAKNAVESSESKCDSTKNHTDSAESSPKNTKDSSHQNNTIDSNKMQIFTELIRSGTEISNDNDIMIFNRVNSGANIKTKKSVFIFGKCDGNVNCSGDYMLLSQISNGKILFNGMAITRDMLKYKLNLIAKDGNIGLKVSNALSFL